jgi:hypothetical protein
MLPKKDSVTRSILMNPLPLIKVSFEVKTASPVSSSARLKQ